MSHLNIYLSITLDIIFILTTILYKLIFSLGFNNVMTRGRRKAAKKSTNFVICHPVLAYTPLYFGRRRFFGVSFLCVFPQRRLVNVANFRCDGGRASILSFLFFASTLLSQTFESYPKGGSASATRIKCQIFWKCKQVESLSVPVSGTNLPFSLVFLRVQSSVVLIAKRLDPAARKGRELS